MINTAQLVSPLGSYIVGDRVFNHKIPALIYGTETNQHPTWYFNNAEFDSFDWTVEPTESLSELYKQRAQEIRDKYNYVILMYSGGSDSHNILMSFLSNGIKLDEVFVSWPVAMSEKQKANPHDYTINNFMSEWELTIKPRLAWLASTHPNVKITIRDWAQRLDTVTLADDFLLNRNHNFTPYADLRWDNRDLLDRAGKHNGVVLYGVDKPKVCFHEGKYKLYFLDISTQMSLPTDMPASNVEFFYWAGSACRLLAKQAHEVVKFFESNKHFKHFIEWPKFDPKHRQFYETATRAVIYPDINILVFQADKPTSMNVSYDIVFDKTEVSTHFWQSYNRNWDAARQVVNKKYFNNNAGIETIVGFINGMWTIKEAINNVL